MARGRESFFRWVLAHRAAVVVFSAQDDVAARGVDRSGLHAEAAT